MTSTSVGASKKEASLLHGVKNKTLVFQLTENGYRVRLKQQSLRRNIFTLHKNTPARSPSSKHAEGLVEHHDRDALQVLSFARGIDLGNGLITTTTTPI